MKMNKLLGICALSAFMCVNAMAEQINVTWLYKIIYH